MTETDLRSQVDAGYASDGTLNDNSPLKGDFVGGLVGFGKNILLQNSRTEKGYVLGSRFVGGLAGGFTGSMLHADSAANTSDVFGNRYVGGIVSVNGSGSIIQTSTNSGLVAGLGKNAAYVGGIVGVNDATWGAGSAAQAEKAQLINCTNSMSGDNATDSRCIRLLQALSTHAGITEYANYVGGLVGYNGTKGSVTWDQYGTPTLGAILYGGTFVGGLAGYNDGNAAIINTSGKTLIIRGQIVADGDAVGGLIGLNTAPVLPAATVAATRVEGAHFVGGVIGAKYAGGQLHRAGHPRQGGRTDHHGHGGPCPCGRRGGRHHRLQPPAGSPAAGRDPCGHAAHLQRRQCADRQHGRDQQRRSGLP